MKRFHEAAQRAVLLKSAVAGGRRGGKSVRKEFMVERQGRSFCLYAGLLDLAHQQGLKSIRTELVQIPSEANNRVAISVATIVLEKDGQERIFTGIGDAAPNNVAPAMQTCLIRMSETRAKARALRDAVNIGVAAFEELGEEDAFDGAPERGYAMAPSRGTRIERTASPRSAANAAPSRTAASSAPRQLEVVSGSAEGRNPASDPATEAQMEAIRSLCRRQSLEPDSVAKEKFGVDELSRLTQVQASEMIKQFNARPANGRTPAGVA